MIYIADIIESDILKINKRIKLYKMKVYELETYFILTGTQKYLKKKLIIKIFDLRKKEKRLQRQSDYQFNGNDLQKTWSGYNEE